MLFSEELISSREAGLGHDDWWKGAVVYQIYPRSFQDSDGDGVGDLRGVRSRLDYLEALGVDVLWLSPVCRSPQADNGYDISDYRSIDPLFGTMEDFDALLGDAHARGMKLVMDLVVNHSSDEHPWFAASRSSKDDPKRDWYYWRPPRPGRAPGEPGAEPNNWGSFFSGSAWTLDEATGEYYLHLFHRKQPDLNWENPRVRAAVHAMMNWWLDRGVDGFRMDVISLISKTYPLVDGVKRDGDLFGDGFSAVANGPRVHEFLHEMWRTVFAPRSRHILTVGETANVTLAQAQRYTNLDAPELDMVFQFEHTALDAGPGGKFDPRPVPFVALKENLARWQEGLAPVDGVERGWNSSYWDNHDQPRAVSRFGDDDPAWRAISAKTLASILHLHRGTPYVYQGEELGQTNTVFRGLEDYRDLESINHFHERTGVGDDPARVLAALARVSRDNARTPMQWDATANAGFTTGEPWIPVTPNYTEINAADQVGVPGSVFEHYRALIALRHDDDAVALGSFRLLAADDPAAWVILRESLQGGRDGGRADGGRGQDGGDRQPDGGREQVLLLACWGRDGLDLAPGSPLAARLADEGLDLGEWSDAERVLMASLPADEAAGSGTGAPERLGGWDSVVLRRTV